MSIEYATTVLHPICPDCGADCTELAEEIEPESLDWRDDRESHLGHNALTIQSHRAAAHPVTPKVGDVVVYFAAWRGMITGTGPLVVQHISVIDAAGYARDVLGYPDIAPRMVTRYRLADPARPRWESGMYWPSVGDPRYPVTFDIVTEYVPPVVEGTLLDLLGNEWADTPTETG